MAVSKGLIITLIAIFLLGFLVYESVFIVNPTMQVLVLEFGDPRRVIKEPGLHWKIPFIESLVNYDKRILSLDVPPEEVIAADKNRLVVDTYTRFRIVDPLRFYQKAGTEERAAQLMTAQISPDLKKTLGKVPFADLLSSKRKQVMERVQREVEESSKPLGVEIIDVRIRRADVPPQNSEAIFRRMNSERERFAKQLRAKGRERAQAIRAEADRQSTVIVAEAKKEGQILRGQGDGVAADIYAQTYSKNPEFYNFYRSLQAYEKSLTESTTPVTMVIDPSQHDFFHHFSKIKKK